MDTATHLWLDEGGLAEISGLLRDPDPDPGPTQYRSRYTKAMYGSVVRRARLSRGLTQRQLANISGIEQANISAIENDRRAPSAETLHRLLTACGYELLAAAGNRLISLPPPAGMGPEATTDQLHDEAPTITPDTPMAVRVRAINEVLDLAETITRSR